MEEPSPPFKQKLILKNFGPIKDLELEIDDLMVFIGPQASGKSTVAKAIYFFKSLRDELWSYILTGFSKPDYDPEFDTFINLVKTVYYQQFGPEFTLQEATFHYSSGHFVTITEPSHAQEGLLVQINFSSRLLLAIKTTLEFAYQQSKDLLSEQEELSRKDYSLFKTQRREAFRFLRKKVLSLFGDTSSEIIYVPASRSMLSLKPNQFNKLDYQDPLFYDFWDRINFMKSIFDYATFSDEVFQEELKDESSSLHRANLIVKDILKGEYRHDVSDSSNQDKLLIGNNKTIALEKTSSGQQESIWVLLLLRTLIHEKNSTTLFIEEPEAHLYPEAQNDIIQLIALWLNSAQNGAVITTHSPYILGAINTLLLAGNAGKKRPEETNGIVKKHFWLDAKRTAAYFMNNGEAKPIMDMEEGLIQSEFLERSYSPVNDTFEKLIPMTI